MREFKLTCDRCKKTETVEAQNQSKLNLLTVGVACAIPSHYGSLPLAQLLHQQEWCEECRDIVGLKFRSEETRKEKPYPTVEEQLIEALRNVVQQEIPQQ